MFRSLPRDLHQEQRYPHAERGSRTFGGGLRGMYAMPNPTPPGMTGPSGITGVGTAGEVATNPGGSSLFYNIYHTSCPSSCNGGGVAFSRFTLYGPVRHSYLANSVLLCYSLSTLLAPCNGLRPSAPLFPPSCLLLFPSAKGVDEVIMSAGQEALQSKAPDIPAENAFDAPVS